MKAGGVKNTGVERAKASQYARHPGRMSNNNTEEPKEVLETEGTRIECSIEEHGKLYGKQIRYLIRSESFGWIGALAFSSAAWRLRAREEWIGWNEENRLKYLNRIVCNSRFLKVPQVKVKNLASHVLSMSMRQMKKDWAGQEGIEPVLVETFVEKGRFLGTCYQAANFQHVGTTQGRGRQDVGNEYALPVKDIYLYPLQSDVSKQLCEGQKKEVVEAKGFSDWAEEEFGNAGLGDLRLRRRLILMARDFYAKPQANIPQACQSRAGAKAAYRFLDNKESSMETILGSHYQSTMNRIREEEVVLAVQDTMAFNLEGTPLGLFNVQCWARDAESYGKKHQRHKLPIEGKESNKWLVR